MEDKKIYAALTGDIIKSSKLTPGQLKEVQQTLARSMRTLEKAFERKLFVGGIDFYRGDGWQLLLSEPGFSLRTALFLRAALISTGQADTRISVGIGEIEHINEKKISQSGGKAFEFSGTGLDRLTKRSYMTVSGILTPQKLEISVFELCDAIVQNWTKRQAEAVFWALQGLDHSQIAENMRPETTRQAATHFINKSAWPTVEDAIKRYEYMVIKKNICNL